MFKNIPKYNKPDSETKLPEIKRIETTQYIIEGYGRFSTEKEAIECLIRAKMNEEFGGFNTYERERIITHRDWIYRFLKNTRIQLADGRSIPLVKDIDEETYPIIQQR